MDQQISFVYSHAVVKKAAKRVWRQYYGRYYIYWIGGILFALVLCLGSGDIEHISAAKTFGSGALVGALSVFIFQFIGSDESMERSIASVSKKLNGTELVYTFGEQSISTESVIGSANRFWRFFSRLWVQSDTWILFNSDRTYLVLPAHLLNPNLQEFIIQKITESGGKVERDHSFRR